MVVLALVASKPAWAQCSAGIGIDIQAEYQGTNTQCVVGLDETHPAGPTVVDYIVTVTVGPNQCEVERGQVWLNLPDGNSILLADKTLALTPGSSQTFDVTTDPYTINSADLGSLAGAGPDEVRATAEVNVISLRDSGPPQDAQGQANWDITVIFPEIDIEKSVEPNNICEGDETEVTYTYLVSWGASGDIDLEDVEVTDDNCSPVSRQADQVGNNDDILEDGEIWVYECTALLTEAITNTATASANDIFIATNVTDTDTAEVTADNPVCEAFTGDLEPDCNMTGYMLCISASGGTPPYTYAWTSSDDGNWPITAGADTNCITYDSGPAGSSTMFSVVITDDLGCDVNCAQLVDCTPPPGDMFCSFTQGFWGNANGKFMGETTEELLDQYFSEEGSLTIGGCGNTVTLTDTDCLLARMPAGGTPRCLEGLGDVNDDCSTSASDDLEDFLKSKGNKKGRNYDNVLMGQIIALTLNLWVDPNLGGLELAVIEGIFCTEGDDVNDVQCFYMPELDGGVVTVQDLLNLANEVLGCCEDDGTTIQDIYDAVTAINEGFDECRTIVECREVCCDGIDNDCDDEIDEGCICD
jgi:hypothetical protein